MARLPILWYFADPMCSWCWGFAPVIEQINAAYSERMRIALLLGGLGPGSTEPLSAAMREEILHHWHEVHRRTGQPFAFEGALPEGFVYDTEAPSRAVITVGEADPASTFAYFKAVQAAFYTGRRDVTRPDVLAELAGPFGIDQARFLARFASNDLRRRTELHFRQARDLGVRGFPTVILQSAGGYVLLTRGWQPFAELVPPIEQWLVSSPQCAS
jgi:putative protein-disulfide isomerase